MKDHCWEVEVDRLD